MVYACPTCKTPLVQVKTPPNNFVNEEIWNCPKCLRNYYRRGSWMWIGPRPITIKERAQ